MSTDITPAPLDPSKVKAGDTVTLTKPSTGTEVKGLVSMKLDAGGEAWDIGIHGLGPTMRIPGLWEVTDHQPAPEWKSGTTGTATVEGKAGVRVMRVDPDDRASRVLPWSSDHMIGGWFFHAEDAVTEFVPDETRPLPSLEQVAEVFRARLGGAAEAWYDHAAAVLSLLRGESR